MEILRNPLCLKLRKKKLNFKVYSEIIVFFYRTQQERHHFFFKDFPVPCKAGNYLRLDGKCNFYFKLVIKRNQC